MKRLKNLRVAVLVIVAILLSTYFVQIMLHSRRVNQPLKDYAVVAAESILHGNARSIWNLASDRERKESMGSLENVDRFLKVIGDRSDWKPQGNIAFQGNDADYSATASIDFKSSRRTSTQLVLDIYRGEDGPFILPTFSLVTTRALHDYSDKFSTSGDVGNYWLCISAYLKENVSRLEATGVKGVVTLGDDGMEITSWRELLQLSQKMAVK